MQDEDKVESQEIDETTPVEESTTEQTTQEESTEETVDEQVEDTVEDEPVEDTEPVDEPDRDLSPRENKRIQQLVSRLKGASQQTYQQPQSPVDYTSQIDADPDTIAFLQQQTQQYGQSQYNQGLEQAKSLQFTTRLELDAPRVAAKHKFLDVDDRDNFKAPAADAVNQLYLTLTGYDAETGRVANPNLRYSEFVDGIAEVANMIAGTKVQQSTRNVARQASQTGIRPDGSSAKRLNLNKSPENMTDEELRAYIKRNSSSNML